MYGNVVYVMSWNGKVRWVRFGDGSSVCKILPFRVCFHATALISFWLVTVAPIQSVADGVLLAPELELQ